MVDTVKDDKAAEPAVKEGDVIKLDDAPALSTDPVDGIKDLKKSLSVEEELASERAARERAESEVANLRRHAASSDERVKADRVRETEANLALATSNLSLAEQKLKDAKADMKAAFDNGDGEAVAEAQVKITRATNERDYYEAQVARIDEYRKQAPVSPREELTKDMDPRAKKWCDEHPEYYENEAYRNRVIAAHYDAQAEGIVTNSPEYFEHVEKRLSGSPKVERVVKETVSTAAPVSRDTTAGKGRAVTANEYIVTQADIEGAEITGETIASYVKNKLALIAEGRMDANGNVIGR
jgi:hypothetical protein